jgi:membrane-bound ClpP family serine protease
VPSPETDPARFETLVGLKRPINSRASRYRSAGVILMGLGFAMLVLLAFAAGVPEVGLGVGGGLAIIGVAAFVNGTLMSRDDDPHSTTTLP